MLHKNTDGAQRVKYITVNDFHSIYNLKQKQQILFAVLFMNVDDWHIVTLDLWLLALYVPLKRFHIGIIL